MSSEPPVAITVLTIVVIFGSGVFLGLLNISSPIMTEEGRKNLHLTYIGVAVLWLFLGGITLYFWVEYHQRLNQARKWMRGYD